MLQRLCVAEAVFKRVCRGCVLRVAPSKATHLAEHLPHVRNLACVPRADHLIESVAPMFVTLLVSQAPIGWSKLLEALKALYMSVTLPTCQLDNAWL